MRSIWKGRLGFGLVGLDVKLYKATEEREVKFHLIHPACQGRINLQNYCPQCQAVVQRAELAKGYEYEKGKYVILTESDLEKLPLKTLKLIDILGFTKDTVDPRLPEANYYLVPEGKQGDKPFWLLYKVMEKLGVRAIGKLAYRDREHLCQIAPLGGVFLLQTLIYADELRDYTEVKPSEMTLSEKELSLGEALVSQATMVFEHRVFENEYVEALEAMIEAKIQGKEIAVAPEATPATGGDLLSQLEAMLKVA